MGLGVVLGALALASTAFAADVTAPRPGITTPTDGAVLTDPTPAVAGYCGTVPGDLSEVYVFFDIQTPQGMSTVRVFTLGCEAGLWRIDAATWGTSGQEPLTPDDYRLSVWQSDEAGNYGGSENIFVKVRAQLPDVTSPETSITAGPRAKTKKRRFKIDFEANEEVAGYEFRLDKGDWTLCAPPHKGKVKPGRHVFRVRAIDPAGNIELTPAAHRWKVKRPAKHP